MTRKFPEPLLSLLSHLKNKHISTQKLRTCLCFNTENMDARVVIRNLCFFFFFLAGHTGDLTLYTWYNRAQVEDLCTMHLHLHGFLVQHPNIIPKETPNDHSY